MKFFIVFLSFTDGKTVPLDATVVSTNIVRDSPSATTVNFRIAWDFNAPTSEDNISVNPLPILYAQQNERT